MANTTGGSVRLIMDNPLGLVVLTQGRKGAKRELTAFARRGDDAFEPHVYTH